MCKVRPEFVPGSSEITSGPLDFSGGDGLRGLRRRWKDAALLDSRELSVAGARTERSARGSSGDRPGKQQGQWMGGGGEHYAGVVQSGQPLTFYF